mmetsp:Transcript_20591/g.38436  ORF Transcript_20591/g.38436 Transcript_20591/m.38436 type:complete len:634 (-) Transcript_20591:25-1926(-)
MEPRSGIRNYTGPKIIEGNLKKLKSKGASIRFLSKFVKRWFVLDFRSCTFFYCKNKSKSKVLGSHPFSEIVRFDRNPRVVEVSDWKFMFIVETKSKTYSLYADSVSAHSLWCTALYAITQDQKPTDPPAAPTTAANALTDDEEPKQPIIPGSNAPPSSPPTQMQYQQSPAENRTETAPKAIYLTDTMPPPRPYDSQQAPPQQPYYQAAPQQVPQPSASMQGLPTDARYQEAADPRAQVSKSMKYEVPSPTQLPPPDYYGKEVQQPPYQKVEVSYEQKAETYQQPAQRQYQASEAPPQQYYQREIVVQPPAATREQVPRQQEVTAKVVYPNKAPVQADFSEDATTIIAPARQEYLSRKEPEPKSVIFKAPIKEDVSSIQREILHPAQQHHQDSRPTTQQYSSFQDSRPGTQQYSGYKEPSQYSGYQEQRIGTQQSQPEVKYTASYSMPEPQPNRSSMIKESLDFGRTGMLDMLQDMEDFDLPKVDYKLRRPPSAVAKTNAEVPPPFMRKTQSRYEEAPASEEVKVPTVSRRTASRDWDGQPDKIAAKEVPRQAKEVQWQAKEAPRQPEPSAAAKTRTASNSRAGYNPKAYQETTAETWSDRKVELGKPMFEEQPIAKVKQPVQVVKSEWDDWDS